MYKIELKNKSVIYGDENNKDPLKGSHTFREFYDYLLRTGQIPYDEFNIDFEKTRKVVEQVLMPKLNLKGNSIIITSTPSEKKGFFYDLWMAKT